VSAPGGQPHRQAHPGGPIGVWIMPSGDAHPALASLLGGAEIQRSADGKPFLPGGPHFNLSHSGDLALVAVCADAPVGVDLEAARVLRNREGLARRMCSERELEFLAGAEDANAALLRLWVRKEAVAKAEGGGISTALSGIDVLSPLVHARGADWFVCDLPAPADGYVAAVAWAADPGGAADRSD
jgi:phosphopantetheinyl transferase